MLVIFFLDTFDHFVLNNCIPPHRILQHFHQQQHTTRKVHHLPLLGGGHHDQHGIRRYQRQHHPGQIHRPRGHVDRPAPVRILSVIDRCYPGQHGYTEVKFKVSIAVVSIKAGKPSHVTLQLTVSPWVPAVDLRWSPQHTQVCTRALSGLSI